MSACVLERVVPRERVIKPRRVRHGLELWCIGFFVGLCVWLGRSLRLRAEGRRAHVLVHDEARGLQDTLLLPLAHCLRLCRTLVIVAGISGKVVQAGTSSQT
ncbi:hypothetical protein HYPSUDRAFT_210207 [Hypholoma sublateritium FD-334 SS-4]|uniref:Uncharacterized protein n=1 Tax=Hypholoma sublateritium (strain FD-334 SS-4) TaxID=945553 RepID=A0A0D2KDW7_HYPSF|nr:hypothetical protein HYPSUDRAFT_210207 [Hypholoma sublateritium FD-334 SS-4]